MRAITIPEPGGPEALVWEEVPDPVPGESEVLVEVVVGAVNRADLPQRQGVTRSLPSTSAVRADTACILRLLIPYADVIGWDDCPGE